MKTLFLIATMLLAASFLSGCAGWSTVKSGIAVQGAKAADEALSVSQWGMCEATTVGAWKRKFGQAPEKAEAWAKLCSDTAVAPIQTLPGL